MTDMSRREFFGAASLAAGVVAFPRLGSFGVRASSVRIYDYAVAETRHGKVRGVRNSDVSVFKGIPYAGRVSGDRRFRRPAPLESWTGTRDALALGPPSIQPGRQATATEPAPAEDCLVLNVWTPAVDGRRRPVMFYSHGGGYVTGSAGSRGQDGSNLARHFDVVVVETNHRLGLLGFLYLDELGGEAYAGSGNNGVLDIVDGLQWVHDNISAFGGDPSNVMIFGESGGGGKTSALYAMPSAAPYFNKASIESGPGVHMTTREVAAETTALLLKRANFDRGEWRKLLELSATDLLTLQTQWPPVPPDQTARPGRPDPNRPAAAGGFGPVVDGVTLPHHPFDPTGPSISRDKPLIVGWNEDEYNFFAWQRKDTSGYGVDLAGLRAKLEPRFGANTTRIVETYQKSRPTASPTDIFVAVQSVAMMGFGSIEIAQRKTAQSGAPVYLYNFGYKSEAKLPGTDYPMGTPHAADIAFKFNNVESPSPFSGSRPERLKASHNFAELWTTFARTGQPAAAGQPAWPPYDLTRRATMRIDTDCEVIDDRHKLERELWTALGYIA
ncbi:MAG: carboxylesterase/lipase family protein [Gemmatimonadaceae bacterium]